MKRIVTTRDSDGYVISRWAGGDEQSLAPVAGRSHREVPADDEADYGGKRWVATRRAFVAIPVQPPVTPPMEELQP